ncbi:MAG: GNAT family N-acetyltransferase [Geobacteraceae bacterium]|nr:GNAT family N-acetyltransferase [Geobacteraceae bacterium]
MEIVPFDRGHIADFLRHAAHEGWITTRSEIEFLLKSYPGGCLVCLKKGLAAGFITSIRYKRSAWIGNLLVRPAFRGQGIGRFLMESVLKCLDSAGCETVWLTASADGERLYLMLGFRQIDVVQRWKGAGGQFLSPGRIEYCENIRTIDSAGWGDERPHILDALAGGYSFFKAGNGFIVSSLTAGMQHIGPWGAACESAAAEMFDKIRSDSYKPSEAVLDVPAKNLSAGEMLLSRGFTISGSTLLMYRGKTPDYNPQYIYSFASMGSYG